MELLFIINPIAGRYGKKNLAKQISARFPGGRIVFTESAGEATFLAKEAQEDVIVAVGGDGTVSEIAKGLMGTEKTMGIIPCGSGNGLAFHLGISRKHSEAMDLLSEGIVREIDCGLFDGDPFFCTCGVGLDATVGRKFSEASHRGLPVYIEKAMETWVHYSPETYSIIVDGEHLDTEAILITAGNANQWGNQARVCPKASVLDGMIDLTIVKPFLPIEIPHMARMLLSGTFDECRRVRTYRGRNISIRRSGAGDAHYDGEPVLKGEVINISVSDKKLRMIVPDGKII